ncbi:MAG: glycosyltransferase family 4 protein [Cyanobacteria bacterium P01_D01_bin.73]
MSNRKSVLIHATTPISQLKQSVGEGRWSPASENRGIPGTEEAVINIARELARHPVDLTVVSPCGTEAGVYDGARWVDVEQFNPNTSFDYAFFVHHDTALECAKTGLKAGFRYLWLHNNYPEDIILPYLDFYEKFMPLTAWSRRLFPRIPDEKIFLTRNGVNVAQTDAFSSLPRQRYRLVYGSDYDRGLTLLLSAWPQIKSRFPQAELDVFYGWNIFDSKTEKAQNPGEKQSRLDYRSQVNQLMEQPGVHHHGRVSHQEVARLFCQADIWAYPCTFPESSCITAMKAQITGAVPVVIPTGALKDTVMFGYKTATSTEQWTSVQEQQACVQEWLSLLVKAMGDEQALADIRGRMQGHCREYFSWKGIAAEWAQEIMNGNAERSPMYIF